tara:strand:+ start:283 stop:1686 length:1404 start_codon:yes stop_codon:yes gene_type:complete
MNQQVERRQSLGALPREYVGATLSISQLWNILWARKLMIIGITLAFAVATVVIVKMMPKVYSATATLLVSSRVDDPMSGKESGLDTGYIATQIEFMRSPVTLLPVVDKFRLTERKEYIAGYSGGSSPEGLRRWAMNNLYKNLKVQQGTGSLFIYVTVDDQNPQAAAQIANAITDTYISEQEKRFLEPAKGRAVRYSEQLKGLKEKVDEAQAKVSAFRKKTGMANLEPGTSGGDANHLRLNDLQARLTAASQERLNAELRLRSIGRGDATVLESRLVQKLKSELQVAEGKMAERRGVLGARHPEIVALQSEIDHARQKLNSEINTYADGARADVSAARAVEARLREELEKVEAQVLASRTLQDDASQLLRELESATKIYEGVLDAFETVQLGTEISTSNVQIVDRAKTPLRPNSSKGKKLLALALIAGGGGGCGLALLLELLNRRIRSREDMERDLQLPVLVQLQVKA